MSAVYNIKSRLVFNFIKWSSVLFIFYFLFDSTIVYLMLCIVKYLCWFYANLINFLDWTISPRGITFFFGQWIILNMMNSLYPILNSFNFLLHDVLWIRNNNKLHSFIPSIMLCYQCECSIIQPRILYLLA